MTNKTTKTADIKASKSKSVKFSKKPAPAKLAEAKPYTMTPTLRSPRKQQLLDMLRRESGAGSAEMITMTGWLPHTLRAALSGLRKQGHNISHIKDESGNSWYRLTASTANPAPKSSRKISTVPRSPRKTDRRSSTPKEVER
jgi:hypothetical protein